MAIKPIQIQRDEGRAAPLDYANLRAQGLTLVQKLSGHIWTDYNVHDPGVTMLEQLCFAITDLAYKTGFPIEEILADNTGQINAAAHSFFSKARILSSGPVTITDYCKLLLDQVADVEQVWIEPVMPKYTAVASKGIYKVMIQPDESITTPVQMDQLAADVRRCLLHYRNLGENFEEIDVLQPQLIAIKASIVVDVKHHVKETLAYICNTIEQTIHPPVRFLSEAELLASGLSTDQIYSGPLLSGGFIPDEDLKPRKTQVDPAELIKAISGIEGVIQVKYLGISSDGVNFNNKPIQIAPGHFPLVDISNPQNDIGIFSGQYEHHSQDAVFWNVFQRIREIRKRRYTGQQRSVPDTTLQASYRDLGRYYSIQHFFPAIYGIGDAGISKHESPARKAQAKQLKAYLLLFEQLLGNYLAQLGNLENIFSPDLDNVPAQTYFSQALYDVPHLGELLKAFYPGKTRWEDFVKDTNNGYVQALKAAGEPDALYQERKERVLDHLLARFNLPLLAYPVTLYERLYGRDSTSPRINTVLQWKAGILRKLPALSGRRIQAFNYGEDVMQTGVYAGYQEWIQQLLYIQRNNKERLTAAFDKDHIVLQHQPVKDRFTLHIGEEILHVVSEIPEEETQAGKYYFGHQPVHLLKYGIDPNNYRIVADNREENVLVLYKAPGQQMWQAVARHTQRIAAIQAQQDMIRHLREISIASEGFYLVEHTLLKPLFRMPSFGFRLLGERGQELLEQRYYCTFDEREQIVKKLYETDWLSMTPEEMQQEISRDCRILIDDITTLALQLQVSYTHMEYFVKVSCRHILPESFFRFGLTVILPCWPARFQYEEFRNFVASLFTELTPPQYQIRFRWLGINAMRQFETDYFNWLQGINDFFTTGIYPAATDALLDFLTQTNHG